jgi:hypothetical protein
MKKPSVEINIDELILHGFSPADRYKIGEALRGELARLIIENGVPSGFSEGKNIGEMNGGTFKVSSSRHARDVGTHVAKSIYGGMRK